MQILEFLHNTALAVGLFVGPLVFLYAMYFKRGIRGRVMQWRKQSFIFITILAFVLNLTFFVLTCFFFASYLGRVNEVSMLDLPEHTTLSLALDCLLLLTGVTLMYAGAQVFFSQYIVRRGILSTHFDFRRFRFVTQLIAWERIKDYYQNADYPLTFFNLIVLTPSGQFERRTLRVPFFALPRFEMLLETSLQQNKEKREFSRNMLRKLSKN